MSEDEARHPIGERRFADPRWATDEPSVRHAPAAIGGEQGAFGVGMAEECRGFPRGRRLKAPRLRPVHETAPLSPGGTASIGLSRALTDAQMTAAIAVISAEASIIAQRCGSCSASSE